MEIAYGVNAENEVYSTAKVLCEFVLITRLNSHASDLWLNPGVFDIGVLQPVYGLVRGLRPCPPLPGPAGSATRITIGHGALARMPPQDLAIIIVPCGPGIIGCCDTPGRLRLVRTLPAVCRRTMTASTQTFQSFTRDFQTGICFDLVVVRVRFSAWSHLRLVMCPPPRFGYGFCYSFCNGVHVGW